MQNQNDQTSIFSLERLPTKRIGFLVNPIAGMGGPVGLKGTDGSEILKKAISLGAKPIAPLRAESFLKELGKFKNNLEVLVGAGDMGENEVSPLGFKIEVIGEKKLETTPKDTKAISEKMLNSGIEMLVFCGGDGTARDIHEVIGLKIPVLGVPTGVKMHSAVFAITPIAAARVAINFLWSKLPLREAEVMDVDESVFREGRVSANLFGYVLAPYEPHLIQTNKLASPLTENELRNQAAIAIYVIEQMQPNAIYIIGPGTTTRTIADLLDQKKTLLGVDIFQNKKIIARDVNENQILQILPNCKVKIIVTPIGGQGFVFGRGNQQISARVLNEVGIENVIVIATQGKLDRLNSLKVDTGDLDLNKKLQKRGLRVISDYGMERIYPVE